jgi:ATP-dependent DNA ligase
MRTGVPPFLKTEFVPKRAVQKLLRTMIAYLQKILRLRQSECYLPKKLCRHTDGDGRKMFQAICKLRSIVSKKLNAPYRSGPWRAWIKVKNPKALATARAIDRTLLAGVPVSSFVGW